MFLRSQIQRGGNMRKITITITIAAALTALALSLPAFAAEKAAKAPGKFTNGMLTDAKGMTLYTFDKDAANSGKSACNGECAKNWPPLMASKKAAPMGDWTVVTRDDGKMQWAYKGMPVYKWKGDK